MCMLMSNLQHRKPSQWYLFALKNNNVLLHFYLHT